LTSPSQFSFSPPFFFLSGSYNSSGKSGLLTIFLPLKRGSLPNFSPPFRSPFFLVSSLHSRALIIVFGHFRSGLNFCILRRFFYLFRASRVAPLRAYMTLISHVPFRLEPPSLAQIILSTVGPSPPPTLFFDQFSLSFSQILSRYFVFPVFNRITDALSPSKNPQHSDVSLSRIFSPSP